MSRPVISICRHCEDDDGREVGEQLYQGVKKLRKALGLKEVFKLDDAKCLGLCRAPCNVVFEGAKRSTLTRTEVHPTREVEAVVEAACAYADGRAPLTERKLPGVSAD